MNPNRRQFLQFLASVHVAAGLPLSATGEAIEQAQVALPIDDALLDAPITQSNPLCWIELDGVRFACRELSIDRQLDIDDLIVPAHLMDEIISMSIEITFSAYWSIDLDRVTLWPMMARQHEPIPFIVGGAMVQGVYSGEARIVSSKILPENSGSIMVYASMNVCGTITRH